MAFGNDGAIGAIGSNDRTGKTSAVDLWAKYARQEQSTKETDNLKYYLNGTMQAGAYMQ